MKVDALGYHVYVVYFRYIVSRGFVEGLTEKAAGNVKRRRSPEEKYGKYKRIRMLVRRNSREILEIKRMLRGVSLGLSRLMDFDFGYLISMVCRDSRDQAILDVLRAAGSDGLPPKKIHARVRRYGLKYHHITRRIKRMNKRACSAIVSSL